MLTSTVIKSKNNRANAYLAKEILEATPKKLLLKIYDFALVHCKKGNMEKTNKAIQELINALRFDEPKSKDFSIGLLKLYQFCQEQMRKGESDIVYKILSDLREAWVTIFNRDPV